MNRQYGITQATYGRLVLDVGQLRIGYVDEANPGALLGATRGGSVFDITTDERDMEADGTRGPVVGATRIARVTATLTVNMIEMSSWVLRLAAAGAEEEASGATHVQVRRYLAVLLRDYRDSVALIGQISGSEEVVVCRIENALGNGGIKIVTAENDEAVLQIVFTAHFNPAYMDAEPWKIFEPYWPRSNLLLYKESTYELLYKESTHQLLAKE